MFPPLVSKVGLDDMYGFDALPTAKIAGIVLGCQILLQLPPTSRVCQWIKYKDISNHEIKVKGVKMTALNPLEDKNQSRRIVLWECYF